MNTIRRETTAGRETLHDAVVAFLRKRPGGVSSREVAEQFFRLKNPDQKTAGAAIRAVLADDRRCFSDANGWWHASSAPPPDPAESLSRLPWMAVYALADPRSQRLLYCALWETIPSRSCLASGWLADPHSLPVDEYDMLYSSTDPAYSRETAHALIDTVVSVGEKHIPIFLSSQTCDLVASACAARGKVLPDDTMLASELLRAADIAVPRPLTLSACEAPVLGAEQAGASARKQGERFAAVCAELLQLLGRKGIESRTELDLRVRVDKEPFFAGKEFSYNTLCALPAQAGVYGFKNSAGAYLYIGKAANLKRRLLSYFCDTGESPGKLDRLRAESRTLVTCPCGSELECLLYEHRLIVKYKPMLNRNIDILERKGTFRPIGDCILLLPHTVPGKGMSVWFRENQKILLKPFASSFEPESPLIAELNSFFFSPMLPAHCADFPEQEIAVRWIKQHADSLTMVPVSRLACAGEIYDAMRIAWRELHPPS